MKCNIKDIQINYEVYGNGRPVVIIHGMSPDLRLMTGCMEPVFNKKDGYKRIYMDLPGMGSTQAADWIKNSDMMVGILIDFIDNIIPGQNFLLAGESYGGYLARGIIHKLPDRVDGLMLLCPSIISHTLKRDVPEHVVLKKDQELLEQLNPSDAEGFDSIQVVQSRHIWERYNEEILCGIKIANNKFLDELGRNGYEFSFEIDQEYNKPTSFIMGRQDSSVGYKDAWKILDSYPRATFAVLDMAGHNLQLEQEDVFNALVNEWIKRVEEN